MPALLFAHLPMRVLTVLLALVRLHRTRSAGLLMVGLLLAVACLPPAGAGRVSLPPAEFVRVRGSDFVLEGRPVRFVGANTNHIWEPSFFDAAKILSEGKDIGLSLVRIFPYAEQFYPYDRTPAEVREVERYWHELDKVLDAAAQRRMRVIIAPPWDYVGQIVFGDHKRGAESHYRFMTDPTFRAKYKQFWTYLLERKNTVNGRVYSDDPTIFGYNVINEWEVADHPKGRDSSENRQDIARWYEEIAGHIKSMATNQLVGTGMIGDDQPGSDFLLQSAVPSIDFATVHAYDHQNPPEWLIERAHLARNVLGKPIVLQEGNAKGNDAAKADYIRRYWDVAYRSEYNAVLFWDWQTSFDGYQVFPANAETVKAVRSFAARFAQGR